MATTRIMPLHVGKGRTESRAISDIIDYVANPKKTDNGRLITGYEVVKMLALDGKLNSMPNNLSGGQQQRVAIGRALITRPALILADEPTGNLDTQNTSEVIALLKEASHLYEQTIVMITHSQSIAQTADRILRVSDGVVTDFGRCKE